MCILQKQIQEWYVQGFGQLQSGTTGAIALADEADAMEAAHDEAAETSHDSHRKQHKVYTAQNTRTLLGTCSQHGDKTLRVCSL